MQQIISMALAALLASTQNKLPDRPSDSRPIYFESLEGNEAAIPFIIYSVRLRSGKIVNIRVVDPGRKEETVELRFVEGRKPISIVVDVSRFRRPQFRELRFLSTARFDGLTILLPYGDDLRQCFANGEKVYARLEVQVNAKGVQRVDDARFANCEQVREKVNFNQTTGSTYVFR
jgi:hypothetical protein